MADYIDLRDKLTELGLSEYIERFLAEGFEEWQTLADITESDLDYLKVKLGHRRKLQREIAKFRDVADTTPLVPSLPTDQSGSSEGVTVEGSRASFLGEDAQTRTKRKYRRHAKPDPHAPEKPPSAYVVFSNRIRDELKDKNLSFADMAKAVGQRWQSLPASERERYEQNAAAAKEVYNTQMTEYRKTEQWAQYNEYLHEFKQALNHQDKRPKLLPDIDGASEHGSTHGSRSRSPDYERLEAARQQHDRYRDARYPALHHTKSTPETSYERLGPPQRSLHTNKTYPGSDLDRSPQQYQVNEQYRSQVRPLPSALAKPFHSGYGSHYNSPRSMQQHDFDLAADGRILPPPPRTPADFSIKAISGAEQGSPGRLLPRIAALEESKVTLEHRPVGESWQSQHRPLTPDARDVIIDGTAMAHTLSGLRHRDHPREPGR